MSQYNAAEFAENDILSSDICGLSHDRIMCSSTKIFSHTIKQFIASIRQNSGFVRYFFGIDAITDIYWMYPLLY